mgnify:CR=1 FL=1
MTKMHDHHGSLPWHFPERLQTRTGYAVALDASKLPVAIIICVIYICCYVLHGVRCRLTGCWLQPTRATAQKRHHGICDRHGGLRESTMMGSTGASNHALYMMRSDNTREKHLLPCVRKTTPLEFIVRLDKMETVMYILVLSSQR